MADRPYTVLSCCVSLDGYLDDASARRLVLSNPADLDRVDALRAGCDAILVGAATVRNDDPRLLVRSPERRAERTSRGLAANPAKVTITDRGKLDPQARFFTTGRAAARLVYCPSQTAEVARALLGGRATVVDAGDGVRMSWLAEDLHRRGVRRLLVEGGSTILTQFLTDGIADELQLAVAPLFVGDDAGIRFVGAGKFPWSHRHRARLAGTWPVGDVVVLRYALSERFREDPEPT